MSEGADHIQQRRLKLKKIAELGFETYPHKFSVSDRIRDLVPRYSSVSAERLETEKKVVSTAGRLVSIRGHGKAGFGHLASDGMPKTNKDREESQIA